MQRVAAVKLQRAHMRNDIGVPWKFAYCIRKSRATLSRRISSDEYRGCRKISRKSLGRRKVCNPRERSEPNGAIRLACKRAPAQRRRRKPAAFTQTQPLAGLG